MRERNGTSEREIPQVKLRDRQSKRLQKHAGGPCRPASSPSSRFRAAPPGSNPVPYPLPTPSCEPQVVLCGRGGTHPDGGDNCRKTFSLRRGRFRGSQTAVDPPGPHSCREQRWHGTGWPGTNSVPSISADGDPILGATLTIQIGNSRGVDTPGVLVAGFSKAAIDTGKGGTLLVTPFLWLSLWIDAAGLSLVGETSRATGASPASRPACRCSRWIPVRRTGSRSRLGSS